MSSISSLRGLLYGSAKLLGDVQAVSKASKTGSIKPIVRRVARRSTGRMAGRLLSSLFR